MKKKIQGVSKPAWMGALAIGLLTPLALWAVVNVNTNTIFEVDGNAIVNTAGNEDWATMLLPPNQSDSTARTGILQDPINATDRIFTGGGSKDERDVSGSGQVWQHTTGAPPDKNNLNHAYAVGYQNAETDGDLHIYFGADRFDNSGDSAIGFWFFQDNVTVNTQTGGFNGQHQVGDILVTSDFRNGGGVSVINVFKWVGGSQKLQLLATGAPAAPGSGSTPFCLSRNIPNEGQRNIACGIANRSATAVPAGWPGGYIDKDGGTTQFQTSTFFEGGINVSELLGTNTTCFSTFLAMTRSSASTTAQLKDFVVGAFPLCEIAVSKVCDGPTTQANSGDPYHTSYTVTVTNNGGGPVFNASFIEDTGDLPDPADPDYSCSLTAIEGQAVGPIALHDGDEVLLAANLAAGDSVSGTVECDTPINGYENTASGIAFLSSGAGAESVTADSVSAACDPFFGGELALVKDCDGDVTVTKNADGTLTPEVCVEITVTNLRNEAVNDILISDNKVPASEFTTFDLDAAGGANDSHTVNVCYEPAEGDGVPGTAPGDVEYTDTATASGTGAQSNETVDAGDGDSATCPLCPTCPACG
jgi:hypothetical protein